MEMESSRRSSMDRSRELPARELPGLKKPRLSEDAGDRTANGGSSRVSSGSQRADPRIRANEREREREEREDSIKGSSSASSSSYQQQQELVAQYKTALAELTFNSKPMITNLTIIAGENLHAAKGIAATICNNVLEVPSEQKLPSLYLLDSIVKNIGRDYIKYFAARLPEVFCKAYKQVDSSIHPGMRHLFGTWKGVFPPAPLQIIEKELGFQSNVNGSSGTTASRSNSQTQRPGHSIHVNPKYLERQRLQQTRAKETNSDDGNDVVTPSEDVERSDRVAITGSTRQWADLPGKLHNIQRPQGELSNDPIYEKKGLRDIKDNQFSVLSRQPEPGAGRISERTKERDEIDKSYYGAGGTASEPIISRRNGFDANRSYGNYLGSAFAQADRQLPSIHLNNTNKSVQAASKNWKNSEEEEYMWDDMDSKLTDYGATNSSIKGAWNIDKADKRTSLLRGQWSALESDQPDPYQDKLDNFPRLKPSGGEDRIPLFRDIDDNHLQPHNQRDADSRRHLETSADLLSVGRAASGHHASSVWPQREPLAGLSQMSSRYSSQSESVAMSLSSGSSTNLISPLPRPGILSHPHPSSLGPSTNAISGSSGIFGQQRHQPLRPPSPSANPPPSFQPLQNQKLHNAIDHDHPQPPFSQMSQKPMQLPGTLNRVPHASVSRDSNPSLAQNQSLQPHSVHNLLQPPSQTSQPSSMPFTQLRHHPPFLHQSQPELPLQQAQPQSQPLIHSEKSQTLSHISGTPQSHGFSGDIPPTNSSDISGQSSTSSLLAAIMNSGLPPNNSPTGLQNFNIQPPLPSGPPPIQALTSSGPVVSPSSSLQTSQGSAPALTAPLTGVLLPPLPPGPPPSSHVSTSSQRSNSYSAIPNPFSSLLSSLVAKGLISSPATEKPTASSILVPPEGPNQSIEFSSGTSVYVPSTSDNPTIPPSSAMDPSVLEPSASSGVASLAPNATELEELIGIDFKAEIIRELHPSVISSLLDDLKHQCDTCGLRFKLQEQLHSHSDLHTSEKSELRSSDEMSRKWYSDTSNWVAGKMEQPQVPVPSTSLAEMAPTTEDCEQMVPADESQSICALCGEPFEDFYSHEMDEWMYKGTVYMNSSERKGDTGSTDDIKEQGPIVHAKCISSSGDNKDLAEFDKMDWTDG